MKRLVVLVGFCVFLLGLVGCQNTGGGDRGVDPAPPRGGVEVIIEGGDEFPEFLVGTWKADKHSWEFVFEPDGTISSAVIDSGMVRVTPSERTATIPLKNEGKGVYELGQWTVRYSPDTRELVVEVVVDHFHLDMRSFGMKGSSTDVFVGLISEDLQIWEAEWFTFPKYILLTPEPDELPIDPEDNPFDTLVFKKQEETN